VCVSEEKTEEHEKTQKDEAADGNRKSFGPSHTAA
jgi:hypothetical protein